MYIESIFFILIAFMISPVYENIHQDMDLGELYEKVLEAKKYSKYDEALSYLDEILKYDSDNSLVLYNKGVILMHLENHEDALTYFEKAIEINPDFFEAIYGKDIALTKTGRNADGLNMFYDPHLVESYNNYSYLIHPYSLNNLEKMHIPNFTFVKEIGYAKLEVRDSNDHLVGYTESHDIFFQYPLAWMFLEKKAEWKPIEINGKELDVLEYSVELSISKPGIYAKTNIFLQEQGALGVRIIEIVHDGFLVKPGDKASVKLILLRLH